MYKDRFERHFPFYGFSERAVNILLKEFAKNATDRDGLGMAKNH
jgi:hypothetical protein